MPRINRQMVTSKRLLPVAVGVAVVLAVAPARWTAWEGWFGGTLRQLVAPVSQPISQTARWIVPARREHDDENEKMAVLRIEAAKWNRLYLAKQGEVDELSRMIRELQKNLEFRHDDRVALVQASVIGGGVDPSTGLLMVRAGTRQGVSKEAVAVVDGVQLVGQVVRAENRVCFVRPITSLSDPRKPPRIEAVIFVDDTGVGVTGTLTPRADGLLQGRFTVKTDPATKAPVPVAEGMEVRVQDKSGWPRSAQMLVIGRVDRIETLVQDPLRKVIIVRPTVEPLEHVAEVTLHVPLGAEDGPEDPGAGTKGGRP